MLRKDTKLRFWCQKVLPLVYDDALSYYELLNKVVLHLNQHTEDINALIDFYDTFTEDVEEIIRQMMEDGEFNEIIADTIGSMIAAEYDPEQQYIIFDYCVYNSKLYRANGSTTGEFDPEKWDERNVGYDLTTIQNYIYSLNAGNVLYDESATYNAGTVGKEIKDIKSDLNDLNAEEIAYSSSETYSSGTVGKEIKDLNTAMVTKINGVATAVTNVDQFRYLSFEFETTADVVLNPNIDGSIIPELSSGVFITRGNADGLIIGSTRGGALFAFKRNGNVWSAINLQLLTTSLGLMETTFVASQNIQAGQIVFAKGTPLLAITDIPEGTPLSTQTNVQYLPNGAINYLKALIDNETTGGTDTEITTENQNFTIASGSKYTVRGHIVEVNCILTATQTTGSQAICTLPTPRINPTIYPPAWQLFGDSAVFACSLLQNGTLYIRGTQVGIYGIHFTYLI